MLQVQNTTCTLTVTFSVRCVLIFLFFDFCGKQLFPPPFSHLLIIPTSLSNTSRKKKLIHHTDHFPVLSLFLFSSSLNVRFEVIITGCRLTVLFRSLISLHHQPSDTFIGCNYGKAIPSTLTPHWKKKAFMICCSSSQKREGDSRAVLFWL